MSSKKFEVKGDLEHGLFTKVSSIHIGDSYVRKTKPPSAATGKQMMTSKGGGDFEAHPPRIFEGEGWHDPRKARLKAERKAKSKQLTYKFTPSGAGKETFAGPIERFSPQAKPQPKTQREPRNFMTNPGKKGTGFGFPDVTLSKQTSFLNYPHGLEEEARRREAKQNKKKMVSGAFKSVTAGPTPKVFDANPYHPEPIPKSKQKQKKPPKIQVPFRPTGTTKAAKAGQRSHMDTFTKYDYRSDPYEKKKPKPKGKPIGPAFRPNPPPKSSFVRSITDMNATRSISSSM